jgi:HPt (histidine-containing phosphotransfer) domain-containing protein
MNDPKDKIAIVISPHISLHHLMNDLIDIDWEQLHQVSEDDPEFELELLTMLAEDVKIHIEDLRQAVVDLDALAIAHEAHYIKGASANVGIVRMTALARQIETLAREQQLAATTIPIEQMAIVLGHLEAYLATRTSVN